MTSRFPAVSGSFYPGDPEALRQVVDALLKAAPDRGGPHKAVIAPHAGLIYSGPVAASAYRGLVGRRGIERVVLIGPSHHVAFCGLAAPSASVFETPLGPIPIDTAGLAAIASMPQVITLDEAHRFEHSLEVQLPFLQRALDGFSLLPLVIGDATPDEIAAVLEKVWGGGETLIVVSSDLSHYHSYGEAAAIDATTSRDIVAQRAVLTSDRACGCRGINGLLTLAARRRLDVRELDRRNSGDTAGPRDRVVGYGAYAIDAG